MAIFYPNLWHRFWLVSVMLMTMACGQTKIIASKPMNYLGQVPVMLSLVKPDFEIDQSFEPELTKFLTDFLDEAQKNSYAVPNTALDGLKAIRYVDTLDAELGHPPAAICVTRIAEINEGLSSAKLIWKEIQVKRSTVAQLGLDNFGFRAVMYHELCHCLMNVGHYDDAPAIMNSNLLLNKTFEANFNKYVKEMFSPELLAKMPQRPPAEEIVKNGVGSAFDTLKKSLSAL